MRVDKAEGYVTLGKRTLLSVTEEPTNLIASVLKEPMFPYRN